MPRSGHCTCTQVGGAHAKFCPKWDTLPVPTPHHIVPTEAEVAAANAKATREADVPTFRARTLLKDVRDQTTTRCWTALQYGPPEYALPWAAMLLQHLAAEYDLPIVLSFSESYGWQCHIGPMMARCATIVEAVREAWGDYCRRVDEQEEAHLA